MLDVREQPARQAGALGVGQATGHSTDVQESTLFDTLFLDGFLDLGRGTNQSYGWHDAGAFETVGDDPVTMSVGLESNQLDIPVPSQ
jgi:hypothetical protein